MSNIILKLTVLHYLVNMLGQIGAPSAEDPPDPNKDIRGLLNKVRDDKNP